MKFSFIIPAYKSEETITKCLKGILEQSELEQGEFEIIIVLCRPTLEFEELIPEHPNIITLKTDVKNRSFSRNLGSSKSKGEFLIFVDSDVYLEQDWLKHCMPVFNNKLVAASQGRFIWDDGCSDLKKRFSFLPKVESSIFSKYGPVVVTGACVYRASIFNALGKFTEEVLWNEDLNLSVSAFNSGYAIAYSETAVAVLLNEKYSLRENLRRSYKSGFHSCQLNKYFYNHAKLKETSFFYLKMIFTNARRILFRRNRKLSLHYFLHYSVKLMGYWVSRITVSKTYFTFPKEARPYKGIKENLDEKYEVGLLYINNNRCLYDTKNRELNWTA